MSPRLCRVCLRPLAGHAPLDLMACERELDRREMMRRIDEEFSAERSRLETKLEKR